jgi:hypothetical protein
LLTGALSSLNLPATIDGEVEKRLREKFDKKWKNNTKLYEATVLDLVRFVDSFLFLAFLVVPFVLFAI